MMSPRPDDAPVIDIRSDTVTRPSQPMRAAMAVAPVGDDQFGDDPTVNLLQERLAALLGKESLPRAARRLCFQGSLGVHRDAQGRLRPGWFGSRTANTSYALAVDRAAGGIGPPGAGPETMGTWT